MRYFGLSQRRFLTGFRCVSVIARLLSPFVHSASQSHQAARTDLFSTCSTITPTAARWAPLYARTGSQLKKSCVSAGTFIRKELLSVHKTLNVSAYHSSSQRWVRVRIHRSVLMRSVQWPMPSTSNLVLGTHTGSSKHSKISLVPVARA